MTKFFNAKNLHSLPDGGLDEKGKRKQKLYTDEHHRSFNLLVTGNSRLFYSQWEKPKHMLKESQKRQPKLTPLGSVEDFSYRSEEHTSELQSRFDLVCRLLLEK